MRQGKTATIVLDFYSLHSPQAYLIADTQSDQNNQPLSCTGRLRMYGHPLSGLFTIVVDLRQLTTHLFSQEHPLFSRKLRYPLRRTTWLTWTSSVSGTKAASTSGGNSRQSAEWVRRDSRVEIPDVMPEIPETRLRLLLDKHFLTLVNRTRSTTVRCISKVVKVS